jgi:hypothetical protein
MRKKQCLIVLCAVLLISTSIYQRTFAQQEHSQTTPGEMGKMTEKAQVAEGEEEMFPHPFLVHMGISDKPGMLSMRLTGYRQGFSTESYQTDFAFHLETGLYNRFGLHVRNDAIKQEPRTDVMLMYTVLQDKKAESGISVFGAGLIPTGTIPEDEDKVIGTFGIGGRKVFPSLVTFDGDIHYMPQMKMAEYEISGVFKATQHFFPVLEIAGEIMKDETTLYLLPALKFKLASGKFIGVGSQIGLTSNRDFDTRALIQLDMDW